MELDDRHIVVTGGAGGIGRALVRRFAAEGARALVVADRELEGARALADEVGRRWRSSSTPGSEDSVRELIATGQRGQRADRHLRLERRRRRHGRRPGGAPTRPGTKRGAST